MLLINPTPDLPIELLTGTFEPNECLNGKNEKCNTYTKSEILDKARRAAEAHRRSRYKAQKYIKPGCSLFELVNMIEDSTRILLKGEYNDGIGFPTGINLNDCAAHFTLNPGDKDIILDKDDVMKVDFGTHVDGFIMDSAFTVAFNPRYENLLKASKEATEAGIKCLGVDVRVCDIGKVISEVMECYEVEIDGKTLPVKAISNLNGHSIDQYKVHAGITIPNINNGDKTRIQEDSFYAVETFATTGKGYVVNGPNCSHYILEECDKPIRNENSKLVLNTVKKKLKTLPFCARYIDKMVTLKNGSLPAVRTLSLLKHFDPYPPLYDNTGSYSAQFEHTIYLSETEKEVLTRGEDY
ncbi:Methionine aminopeptidase 2 [Binucleata daphniae]